MGGFDSRQSLSTCLNTPNPGKGFNMDRYLVIVGDTEPAVVVGPFPEGFNPLKNFPIPPGYHTATAFPTREEAESEAEWHWSVATPS